MKLQLIYFKEDCYNILDSFVVFLLTELLDLSHLLVDNVLAALTQVLTIGLK